MEIDRFKDKLNSRTKKRIGTLFKDNHSKILAFYEQAALILDESNIEEFQKLLAHTGAEAFFTFRSGMTPDHLTLQIIPIFDKLRKGIEAANLGDVLKLYATETYRQVFSSYIFETLMHIPHNNKSNVHMVSRYFWDTCVELGLQQPAYVNDYLNFFATAEFDEILVKYALQPHVLNALLRGLLVQFLVYRDIYYLRSICKTLSQPTITYYFGLFMELGKVEPFIEKLFILLTTIKNHTVLLLLLKIFKNAMQVIDRGAQCYAFNKIWGCLQYIDEKKIKEYQQFLFQYPYTNHGIPGIIWDKLFDMKPAESYYGMCLFGSDEFIKLQENYSSKRAVLKLLVTHIISTIKRVTPFEKGLNIVKFILQSYNTILDSDFLVRRHLFQEWLEKVCGSDRIYKKVFYFFLEEYTLLPKIKNPLGLPEKVVNQFDPIHQDLVDLLDKTLTDIQKLSNKLNRHQRYNKNKEIHPIAIRTEDGSIDYSCLTEYEIDTLFKSMYKKLLDHTWAPYYKKFHPHSQEMWQIKTLADREYERNRKTNFYDLILDELDEVAEEDFIPYYNCLINSNISIGSGGDLFIASM